MSDKKTDRKGALTRRALLASAGLGASFAEDAKAVTSNPDTSGLGLRQKAAYKKRLDAAWEQALVEPDLQIVNTDEASVAGWAASFTKGLPHKPSGEVQPAAMRSLLDALESGRHADFENITLGGDRRLVNPQASYTYAMEGADAHRFAVPPAPALSSREAAWEMTELYWQSLTRDVPFSGFGSSPIIREAARELGTTARTVFRGETEGDGRGPYVSQFLLQPIPYLAQQIDQRHRVPRAGTSFMTSLPEWFDIQNGAVPARSAQYDETLRYIHNGRGLAEYVHFDVPYQPYLHAAMILLRSRGGDERWVLSPSNPYRDSATQDGFVTFGKAHIADWLGRVTTAALKAAWCQKWLAHRRMRPETFGGRVHQARTGAAPYSIHADLMKSNALMRSFDKHGTYLLAQAYPEGSPTHPAYPAGHATVAGACSAVLKAFFDENAPVENCVESDTEGLNLIPCSGFSPTVGDEVNKLAFNIAMGRDWAGIHYRSDARAGMRLGEEVAISMLQDLARTFTEDFEGFSFTRLDGSCVHVA